MWQARWASHYVGAKLHWNTKLNADDLVSEAYDKYYGNGSDSMKKYHKLRLKLWNNADGHAFYGGPERYESCLAVPGAEEKLNKFLARAEAAAKDNPVVLKRIAADRKYLNMFWKPAAEKFMKRNSAEMKVKPQFTSKKIKLDGRLTEDAWMAARSVDGFYKIGTTQEATQANNFRVIYDNSNIYVGFVAMNDKAWVPEIATAKELDSKMIWKDDHIELQFNNGNGEYFYHVCVNTLGTVYDSKMIGTNIDSSVNLGVKAVVKKLKDRFVYEICVPVAAMEGDVSPGNIWGIFALRSANNLQPPENKEISSLDGRRPHSPSTFRKMSFGKNVVKNGDFSQKKNAER
jgi:hypothetical protein